MSIDHGRIIADGTPAALKASVGSNVLRMRLRDERQRETAVHIISQTAQTIPQLEPDPAALTIPIAAPERLAHILTALTQASITLTEFSLEQPSLDEVFLALTGQPTQKERLS